MSAVVAPSGECLRGESLVWLIGGGRVFVIIIIIIIIIISLLSG